MTEKRFTFDGKDCFDNGEFWLDLGLPTYSNIREICNMLNELAEEKEICKQAYREIKEDAIKKAEENNGLKAENEQLKQRVQQLENNIEKYIGAKYKKFVDGEVGGWSIGTVNELLNELSDENR